VGKGKDGFTTAWVDGRSGTQRAKKKRRTGGKRNQDASLTRGLRFKDEDEKGEGSTGGKNDRGRKVLKSWE